MKKTLLSKIKDGAKTIIDAGKSLKYALPIAAGMIYGSATDANAQDSYKINKHNKGATVMTYKPKVSDKQFLEKKRFGEIDNVYLQFVPMNKYDDDLDIAALVAEKTTPVIGIYDEKIKSLNSYDGMYYYRIARDSKGKIIDRITICDQEGKSTNFDSSKYIEKVGLEGLIPSQRRFDIPKIGEFIDFQVPDNMLDEDGKLNHFLLDVHSATLQENPLTGEKYLVGDFYRGVREEEEAPRVIVNYETGETTIYKALDAKADTVSIDSIFQTKPQKTKKENKNHVKGPSVIIEGSTNSEFDLIQGKLGLQIGPLAGVVNYGIMKDQLMKDVTTAVSPTTGRYGTGTETQEDIKVLGGALEIHPFHKRAISPFFGFGMNKWDYTTKVVEQIRDSNGNVIKENSNSFADSEISYKGIVGSNLKLGEKTKLRISGEYDTRSKLNFGIGLTQKLGRK